MRQSIAQEKMTNGFVLAHHWQKASQRLPLPKPNPGPATVLGDELDPRRLEGGSHGVDSRLLRVGAVLNARHGVGP